MWGPAFLLAVKLVVHAEPEAAACPTTDQVARSVETLVGKHAFSSSGNEAVTIEVEFARPDSSHVARVRTTRDGRSTTVRELHDGDPQSCAGVAEALTLTLALILDTMEGQPPPAAPAPAAPAPPRPEPPQPSSSAAIAASAMLTTGLLASTRGAGQALFEIASTAGHSGGIGLLWAPPESTSVAPGDVSVSIWAGTLRGCLTLVGNPKSAHLLGCVQPALGVVHARARGYAVNDSASRPWIALGGELAAAGPIAKPLGWVLRAGLLFPLHQENFSIDGLGTVYTASKQAGYLAAGLSWTIW